MLRTKTVAFFLGIILLAALASPTWAAPRTEADTAVSGVLAWLDQIVSLFSVEVQTKGGVGVNPRGDFGETAQVEESGEFVDPSEKHSSEPEDVGGDVVDPGGALGASLEDESGVFTDPGG